MKRTTKQFVVDPINNKDMSMSLEFECKARVKRVDPMIRYLYFQYVKTLVTSI